MYMWSPSFVNKASVRLMARKVLGSLRSGRVADMAILAGAVEAICAARRGMVLSLVLLFGLLTGCESLSKFQGQSTSPATHADEVQRRYQEAIEAITQGEYETARITLEELVEANPSLVTPYVNLGIVAERQGNREQAMQWYQKALELDAAQPEALNQLGILYRQEGQLNKALEAYRSALAANEGLPQIHYNLGILYDLYLGDYAKAVQHYERYQELTGAQNVRVQQWIQDLKRRSR